MERCEAAVRADQQGMEPPAEAAGRFEQIIAELLAAAQRAGVGVDRHTSRDWLHAVERATVEPGEFSQSDCGAFGGHELALLDFDPTVVGRLRRVAEAIATPPRDGVRTALAIAGSTAQSRIQPFPADADFFERVHITAPTRDKARSVLADLIRTTALGAGAGRGFRLQGVLLGIVRGHQLRWTPEEVATGALRRQLSSGEVVEVAWRRAVEDPGFVKIDWTLLDRDLGGPMYVSKVVDATWAAPDGTIHSLDGAIDADYQQVYLDGRGAELTAELMSERWETSREQYVRQMEREVVRYVAGETQDYVKVAKRLYNLCRVTGRFAEALYLRELFDEPMARLHQVRVQFDLARRLEPEELCELADDLAELATEMRDWSAGPHLDALIAWASQPTMKDVAQVQQAFHVLGQAIAEAASRAFDERLRAYPPLGSILDDICDRHAM